MDKSYHFKTFIEIGTKIIDIVGLRDKAKDHIEAWNKLCREQAEDASSIALLHKQFEGTATNDEKEILRKRYGALPGVIDRDIEYFKGIGYTKENLVVIDSSEYESRITFEHIDSLKVDSNYHFA